MALATHLQAQQVQACSPTAASLIANPDSPPATLPPVADVSMPPVYVHDPPPMDAPAPKKPRDSNTTNVLLPATGVSNAANTPPPATAASASAPDSNMTNAPQPAAGASASALPTQIERDEETVDDISAQPRDV
eukprot:6373913-Amphidinium_carterae.1